MPRDRGGIGRTGNKPKKSAAKRAAAAEATADKVSPSSPTSAEAAPTNKEEEEGLPGDRRALLADRDEAGEEVQVEDEEGKLGPAAAGRARASHETPDEWVDVGRAL